jgi:uncharacterized protein YPO0396
LGFAVPDRAGFRLWNVELLNWGTFDGSIVSFPIEGRDSFITGAVGAGKSTLVDALTTLFVPAARIVYNKAAGAGKNERRLETYLRGVYSTAADDTGSRAKPVALRSTKHLSAVLAHFRDDEADADAVFVHVYYFTAAGTIEKIFAVSDRPITLEQLLAGANSDPRRLQKLIRARTQRCDSWRDYQLAVRRKLGLPHAQALELWYQTVSMKQVANLTTFVRSHMLEPPDETREKIQSLVDHYQDLTASAAAIERARAQLAILDPLVTHFDDHDRHASQGEDLARVRDQVLEAHYQGIEIGLVEAAMSSAREKMTAARARKQSLADRIKAANDRIMRLEKSISDAGGAALSDLDNQIESLTGEVTTRQRRWERFIARCNDAGVEPARDLDGFLALRRTVQTQHDDAAQRAEEQRPDYDTIAALHRKRQELGKVEAAVESLRHRRSNLDAGLLELRGRIAEAAGVADADLPFVGELLQVRADHRDWEPAVQRLLHGFGSTLLVPEFAYRGVSEWVDRTNLRARLTYQAVPAETKAVGRPAPGTLPEALDVAPSSPMADWLRSEVLRRFRGIHLASSMAEFRRADQAITKQGQVKRLGRIHEKDDRYGLGDQRRYVLGWDNTAKVGALTDDAARLRRELTGLERALRVAEAAQRESQTVMNATDTLLREYDDFAAIDVVGAQTELSRLHEEQAALLANSATLATLREQVAGEERERQQFEKRHEAAVGDAEAWKRKLDELEARRQDLPTDRPDIAETDAELLAALHAAAEQRVAAVTLANIDRVKTAAREALQAQIDAATKRAGRAREAAVRAMEQFKERYPQDALDMDATMESAHDFRAVHRRLVDDDLPRFEAEFRRQLSENTLREVAGFNQHLEERRSRIKNRIDRINESLERIDYTANTHIAVEAMANTDPDLATFRRDLRECIDGTLGGGDDAYTRERFDKVKAIVDRFQGRVSRTDEDRAWTARVSDVRNWYTFAIVERDRATGETVAYYSDSEGKSGGEKEKLAYTVLAAAVSYQFGLVPGDPRPKTFRFIALDEAFARGSDASTRFALQLFKTMGLQLLVVTPLQKKEVIAPYVERVALIAKDSEQRSRSLFMKIEDYQERLAATRRAARDAPSPAGASAR